MNKAAPFFALLAGAFWTIPAVHAAEPAVVAASFAQDEGDAERVESGDLLRIYSQQVAAAACFYHNDIDQELSVALLKEAREGFDVHLSALLNGDKNLGIIGGEQRKKTIVKLQSIEELWAPMATSVDALLASSKDKNAMGVIKDQNMALFEKTNILVSELEGQYSNPAVLVQADVLTLEIVGRQAMMTQKIAKNICKIWSGRDTEEVREQLNESIKLYDISLNALIHGMPAVGLQPAPTKEIEEGLVEVQADWLEIRDTVTAITDGSTTKDDLTYLFRHMAEELHKLEEITHQYVIFSKHEY